jgi:hypothetical protein
MVWTMVWTIPDVSLGFMATRRSLERRAHRADPLRQPPGSWDKDRRRFQEKADEPICPVVEGRHDEQTAPASTSFLIIWVKLERTVLASRQQREAADGVRRRWMSYVGAEGGRG